MYGLPEDFDASVFLGRELSLVSFTINTVYLCFDEVHSITIEAQFLYQPSAEEKEIIQTIPGTYTKILSLIGKQVIQAESQKGGFLRLSFEGGGSVTCLDDSKQYESYHLQVGAKQIDV